MTLDLEPRYLVTGATGELGRLVIAELLTRIPAARLVAGVRSQDHDVARTFRAKGVETRLADYDTPESLRKAFSGIGRLLLISAPAGPGRLQQHLSVIEAAKEAEVRLIAYTSLLHADRATSGLGEDHRRTEAALRSAGLPHVLLRHGWYIENHIPSVAPALDYGAVIGCAGSGRFSSASRADYAAADALVLTLDGQAGLIHELAGDDAYTLADLAEMISVASHTSVAYRDMPREDFARALIGMGLPAHVADVIADSDVAASLGEFENSSGHLRTLIGRPGTSSRSIISAAVSQAKTAAKG